MTDAITGDRKLDRALQQLAQKEARKVSRRAVNKGLTVVARAVRQAVPPAKTPGHSSRQIKKSVGSRNRRNRRKGLQEAKAGVGVGKKRGVAAPHAHIVALGTANRTTARGASRGRMPANDFVQRGFNQSAGKSRTVMLKSLQEGIEAAGKAVRR